jgi:hypothetical protein
MSPVVKSSDRHLGHGYYIRLDGTDYSRFAKYKDQIDWAASRIIKQAVREFLDRHENEEESHG